VLHHFLPSSLGFTDVLDCVTGGAVAAGAGSDPVRFGFDFGARVFHRDGKSTPAHHREIDDVVSNEGGFGGGDFLFFENLTEDASLVLNALVNMVNFQIS